MNLFLKLDNNESNKESNLILFPDFLPEVLSFTTSENERIQDLYLQLCSLSTIIVTMKYCFYYLNYHHSQSFHL